MPVAHHEGNYFAPDDTLKRLEDQGQIAFRYCTPSGEVTPEASPNGAAHNIAGVFNETKTILGLMPHPERLCDPALGGVDGKAMFDSLAEALS
jgi:phosphoribosylformylglycinamidine synthase